MRPDMVQRPSRSAAPAPSRAPPQAPAIAATELEEHFHGGAEYGGEGRLLAAVVEEMRRHRDSFLAVAAPAVLAGAALGRANPPPPSASELSVRGSPYPFCFTVRSGSLVSFGRLWPLIRRRCCFARFVCSVVRSRRPQAFWLRKTRKPVLAVLAVARAAPASERGPGGAGALRLFRGINLEVRTATISSPSPLKLSRE